METGLSLGHTILDSLNAVAAREWVPRTDPVGFQDHVRIYEHGALVSRHQASQIDRTLDAVRREQVCQVFDRQIKQARYAPDRHVSPFDGETENLDERS